MNRFTPSIFSGALFLCSAISRAGGFESPGIGPKALAMGGAFIGLADDWSAAFWNPAGLAFQSGWGTGASIDLLDLHAHDGNGMANPGLPFTEANIRQGDPFFQYPPGSEPSSFGIKDTTIHAALPSVVAYKNMKPWAFSLGVFAPLGFAFDVDDRTVSGYRATFDEQGYIVEYNLSLAREWQDRWAVGVGVNWLDARLKRNALKQTPTYDYAFASDARGQALQGVFGFLGRLHPKVSMGASYKTAATIHLKGNATVLDTRFPVAIPGFGTLNNETSAGSTDLLSPATYGVGFAFFPTSALTLTTDWQGTDWRATRIQTDFDQQGVFLQNQDLDAGWEFTNRARVGGEYRWSYRPEEQMTFRAGYSWDPAAVSDSGVSMTNLVDVSRHLISCGLAWKIHSWEPAVSFVYETGSRTIHGVEYSRVDRLVSLGIHYHTL